MSKVGPRIRLKLPAAAPAQDAPAAKRQRLGDEAELAEEQRLRAVPRRSWLVGPEGGAALTQALSTADNPVDAVLAFSKDRELAYPAALPALGLLDTLRVPRSTSYRTVLSSLIPAVSERVQTLSQVQLRFLLDSAFRYIAIDDLQPVVLAVLARVDTIPETILRHVVDTPSIYDLCPVKVKRQVWLSRPDVFASRMMPLVRAWRDAAATPALIAAPTGPLAEVVDAIGTSTELYERVCRMLQQLYASPVDDRQASRSVVAGMRWQLLLRAKRMLFKQVCDFDPCYALIGLLDEFTGFQRDGADDDGSSITLPATLGKDRISKLAGALAGAASHPSIVASASASPSVAAESVQTDLQPISWIADIAIVLSEQHTWDMLTASLFARIVSCMESTTLPKHDPPTLDLFRMAYLASSAPSVLQDRPSTLPPADRELQTRFLPMLCVRLMDDKLRSTVEPAYDDTDVEVEPIDELLVQFFTQHRLAQALVQAYLRQQTDPSVVTEMLPLLASHNGDVYDSIIADMAQHTPALAQDAAALHAFVHRLVKLALPRSPYLVKPALARLLARVASTTVSVKDAIDLASRHDLLADNPSAELRAALRDLYKICADAPGLHGSDELEPLANVLGIVPVAPTLPDAAEPAAPVGAEAEAAGVSDATAAAEAAQTEPSSRPESDASPPPYQPVSPPSLVQ